jgi:RND superfamily putative drug exporter
MSLGRVVALGMIGLGLSGTTGLMFQAIAAVIDRRPWLIVLGWLAFAAFLYATAPEWERVSRDDEVRFFPPGYPSVIGQDLLDRGFPDDSASSLVVWVVERPSGPLTPRDLAYVDEVARRFLDLKRAEPALGIKQVVTHRTPVIGPRLRGRSQTGGEAVLTMLPLRATYVAKQARLTVDRLQAVLAEMPAPPEGLNTALTGSAVVGHDMNAASIASVHNTTTATIALVVVILLVVYRSPLLALIPLVTIAMSVWAALKAIPLLTEVPGLKFQVINITNIFVVVILFGAGTDYCLFLIARYREELARGRRGSAALSEAIQQVGGALVASAGTVICGLGMLWFSSFAKTQYTGPAIALSLAISLAASLTLAPVLLHWLRGAVFWPFQPPRHERGADPEIESLEQNLMMGFWLWVANQVVRRPGVILAVSVLALTPLAVVGARTHSSYSQLADLSRDQPSVVGAEIVQRYFAMGELSPSTILIHHPTLDFLSAEGQAAIAEVSRRLAALPEVAEVRSVSQPLGKPEPIIPRRNRPATTPGSFLSRLRKRGAEALLEQVEQGVRALTDAYYVSTKADGADRNHITRLVLVFRSDPFSPKSLEALEAARRTVLDAAKPGGPLAGTGVAVGLAGATASVLDLRTVTTRDEYTMFVLVTSGVYAILLLLLRRPGICLYLIVTVVFGYLASLGLTELVFRAQHQGPGPWVGLDWKVGFFLFVILVAVGEDYNIFLMARVIEEERRHGPIEGTRLAVAHTGGIISSCGLIMAGTFGSMLVASLTALRELGFALSLGVLLDTFIVRPILVPAFLVLLHRRRAAVALTPLSPLIAPHDQAEAAATSAS